MQTEGRMAADSIKLLLGLLALSALFSSVPVISLTRDYAYSWRLAADIFGFLALLFICASGAMMLFKRRLVAASRSLEAVRKTHLALAAMGGVFLILHAGFFLFPGGLLVLSGYAATGAALVVWLTGIFFLQGARGSLLYHGLFSVVGISLMLVHALGLPSDIPSLLAGLGLTAAAAALFLLVALQLSGSLRRGANKKSGAS